VATDANTKGQRVSRRRPQQRQRAPRLSAHHTKPQQSERTAWRLLIAELTDDTDQRRLVTGQLLVSASSAEMLSVVGVLVDIAARALIHDYGEAGAVGIAARRLGELAPTAEPNGEQS
jgi:hypothetical protein